MFEGSPEPWVLSTTVNWNLLQYFNLLVLTALLFSGPRLGPVQEEF